MRRHKPHRSLYRKRSIQYKFKKFRQAITLNIFQEDPFFKSIKSTYIDGDYIVEKIMYNTGKWDGMKCKD